MSETYEHRNENIFVTKQDINRESEPQLMENLLKSKYENGDHYYGTQFALLREELVRPLCESVNTFRNGMQLAINRYKNSAIFADQINSFMYGLNNSSVHRIERMRHNLDNNLIVLTVTLTLSKFNSNQNVNELTKSMPLQKGWLVCLSCDYFQNSIIFSVILDSEINGNCAHLKLLLDLEDTEQQTLISSLSKANASNNKYIAIECLIENMDALRTHLLPKLQRLNRNDPLFEYINNLNSRYENDGHYFDERYGLLRNKFVRVMIECIVKIRDKVIELESQYKLSEKIYYEMKSFAQSITDFNAYTDVAISDPSISNSGVVLKVNFDISELKGIDWGETSRLIQGSLLCISCDYFQNHFIFGVITKMKIKYENNELDLDVRIHVDMNGNGCEEFMELLLARHKKYFVIEALTFYEGIKHSLSKLQELNHNFYFLKYLLNGTKHISPPQYLSKQTKYDLNCVANSSKNDEPNVKNGLIDNNRRNLSSIELLNCDKSSFVQKKLVSLDSKQFDAYFAAITKEFCIIQGPPGTGKTFVGLKIVNCLLDNKNVWCDETQDYCPILIVCYKNHALDQFLEGILNLTDNIIRIGFKDESEKLKNHRLNMIREKVEKTMYTNSALFRRNRVVSANDIIMTDVDDEIEERVKSILSKFEVKQIYKQIIKFQSRIRNLRSELELIFSTIKRSFQYILGKDIIPFIKKKYLRKILEERDTNNDETVIERIKMWLSEDGYEIQFRDKLKSSDNVHRWSHEMDIINERNINSIDNKLKWRLYLFWRQLFLNDAKKRITARNETLNEEIKKLTAIKTKLDQVICSDAQIVGATITGAAKYRSLIQLLKPKIMIVEEAAEVLEAHLISAIPNSVQHLILIGDHQQLRPIANVMDLSKKFNFDVSLFERMIVYNKLDHYQLTLQHRMRPCISELLKVAEIYKDLRNGERVKNYPKTKFTFNKDLFFLNHTSFEDDNNTREVKDKSRSNLFEANFVVELVNYFLQRKVPADKITVLATYNSQLKLIKSLMFDKKDIFVKLKDNTVNKANETEQSIRDNEELRVRVSSVDGYQGEENDILIISFVRSNKKGNIGFLNIPNRVCVALSRAKHAMYCIGNFESMASSSKMWKKIVDHLKNTKAIDDKFTLGCECFNRQLTMPHQFGIFNQLVLNRQMCKCNAD